MNNQQQQQHQPKLENFLGGNSFGDHHDHSTYCSLQLPSQPEAAGGGGGGGGGGGDGNTNNTNSIGLSMIKTWLRNQPLHTETNNNESGARVQQTLSLSMSTGSQSSSSLPLITVNVSGESSSSENKQPPTTAVVLDSNQTVAAVDSTVPRKSIDTFGQRTSIYRGVTRLVFWTKILFMLIF